MKAIGITQRVTVVPRYGERRDCLDQAWARFLSACDLLPIMLPNVPEVTLSLCESLPLAGYILTGGNDLEALGGEAPERDASENVLLDLAERQNRPVLGVCRGMQVIQQRHAIPLRRVEGHVATRQTIRINGESTEVNSFHNFGAMGSRPPLDVWASAEDGVVKAIRHSNHRVIGIMWHPERFDPFRSDDIGLVRRIFGVN
jgi:N5-(cytidine 5'-diphosphoramidyl)-L-glutamine hydrolase